MTQPNENAGPASEQESFWSRNQLSAVVLLAATILLLIGCFLVTKPFLPALAWAVALAIIGEPAYRWIKKHVRKPGLAAALSVVLVSLVIAAPVALMLQAVISKASSTVRSLQSGELQKSIEKAAESNPRFGQAWDWVKKEGGAKAILEQAAPAGNAVVKPTVGGTIWSLVTFLITLFMLFYFWRDRSVFIDYIRDFLPLTDRETNQVFNRFRDTVHASIYGTLVVATLQGVLGGLMFWWLGLPAPLLWGFAMGLLSVIPVLGAFVIWIPAAVFLAVQGDWTKAVILTVWGTVVVGLIDNLLYPVLVGKKLRLHTVPVFIGIVGGLMVFGAAGLVLGPVLLALTDAVLCIWRSRTANGKTADAVTNATAARKA
ncbi:MAG TPA: AI-2E family transporter [Verrucomicrobiae bacterium]|nr:AI-2E family transporter [Verrucomicrobiae bacterium]